jgi:N-methylhydantoinase B
MTYPYGVAGGKPGAPSKKTLVRAGGEEVEMPSKVSGVPVYEGDLLLFETAGAGGVGDPLSRDPEAVAKDVRWNLVSREAAREEYGVALDDSGRVDAPATETERERIRSGRSGDLPRFDHGPVPSPEELGAIIAKQRREFDEWLSGELGGHKG